MSYLLIHVAWDRDAGVWYVDNSDIPGLHAEAATEKDLVEGINEMLPDLLKFNMPDADPDNVAIAYDIDDYITSLETA